MAGRDEVPVKAPRVFPENAEFNFSVAQDIGIWRAPGAVFVEEVAEDTVPVLTCKIDVMQGYIELLTNLSRILQVFRGRAVTVVILPIGHVQGVNLGALLFEENCRYSGIHAAGQSEDDFFAFDIR